MPAQVDVVVVGGGQAGLSASYELTRHEIEHVVLERARIGERWRRRWESFCLVTPNWTVQLPGGHYDLDDPDGYMPRDEIWAYLERYASGFGAPVREGVDVLGLSPDETGVRISTSDGELHARAAVVATGAYQRPYRPPGAQTLPSDLPQLDADDYRDPASLQSGAVLIVGSGQSGCQIAEELQEAGREVFLSCGRAPWVPRSLGDRDILWWVIETGMLDEPVSALPSPAARLTANLQNTGRRGGHDLNYRTLRYAGVTLLGRFRGAEGRLARFAPDLAESVAWGDARNREIMDGVRALVAERGVPMPEIPEPERFDPVSPETIDLSGFGSVIFAGGYRSEYARWIDVPGAFDDMGYPLQVEGASTAAPGLYFLGVHFLRKRKSSLLCGVGEDAEIVARQIAASSGRPIA